VLWIVLELFVSEKGLLVCCKYKFLTAINAEDYAINKFHLVVSQRIWDRKTE